MLGMSDLKVLYLHENEALGLSDKELGPDWREAATGGGAGDPGAILRAYFDRS